MKDFIHIGGAATMESLNSLPYHSLKFLNWNRRILLLATWYFQLGFLQIVQQAGFKIFIHKVDGLKQEYITCYVLNSWLKQ
jgi:hypothetical protein